MFFIELRIKAIQFQSRLSLIFECDNYHLLFNIIYILLKDLLVNFNQGKHEEVRKLVGKLIRVNFIQMKDQAMKSKFVYKLLVISKYLYILICISIPIVFIYESYQGDNVDFMIYIHAFIIFSILGVLTQYSTSNFFEKEK